MSSIRLATVFIAATFLNLPVHAVQVNVLNAYNGVTCTGPVNTSWIEGVSGVCQIVRRNEYSMRTSCGVTTVFPKSTTCQGNSSVPQPAQKCRPFNGGSNSYQPECADYALVAAVTLQDSCTQNWTPYMYLPVMSFKVVQQANKQLTMTSFDNANCQGAANHTVTVTKDVCVSANIPLLGSNNGLIIGLYDDSAPTASTKAPVTSPSSAVGHGMATFVLLVVAAALGMF
ncbi:hypothetical protein BASA81_006459 [Batrachochytrium salamandrivorans]|nr:hypothetical protein BASA81_006459 [Batrachochytrium salamandrivorans]